MNTLDAELRAVRASLNELHDRRGKEQVRQTQLQLRIENLLEHVTRRYQLDLREFAAGPLRVSEDAARAVEAPRPTG